MTAQIEAADVFYRELEAAERAGLMPTLIGGKADINLENKEARAEFTAAERFRSNLDQGS